MFFSSCRAKKTNLYWPSQEIKIFEALDQAKELKGKPTAIIAKTVKGKGVSFMENNPGWHGKAPNEEEAKKAIAELGGEW